MHEAVDLAKRHLIDSVYSSVKIEGLPVTFPQTKQIIENAEITKVKADNVQFVLNMRNAWKFLLDTLDCDFTLMYVRELNKICGYGLIQGSGDLRQSLVSIGGSTYIPSIPSYMSVLQEIDKLNNIEDNIQRAVAVFEYLSKAQLFIDGNKRVAQLAANKILISSNEGILKIPDTDVEGFISALVDYYETGSNCLENFLLEKCLIRVVQYDYVMYKDFKFPVKDILSILPESVKKQYSSELECAKDNVELLYKLSGGR